MSFYDGLWPRVVTAGSAVGWVVALGVGTAHAAQRQGGSVSCGGGALVQTYAHSSGLTNFRHYQGSAYRGTSWQNWGGMERTYTSGYANINRPSLASAAWVVWNGPSDLIGEARSFCSPPP